MSTFTLHLHSMTAARTLPDVRSLVARDASGSFGIQAFTTEQIPLQFVRKLRPFVTEFAEQRCRLQKATA